MPQSAVNRALRAFDGLPLHLHQMEELHAQRDREEVAQAHHYRRMLATPSPSLMLTVNIDELASVRAEWSEGIELS